ncbi:MAG: hypothetical protein ACREAN_00750 [Nitrosopumilaceae archaeon]
MKYILGGIFGLFMLLLPSLTVPASQEQVASNLVPESDVVLQKVVINMNIPDNPNLPFACVWGTVQNPAPGYPVEIEIFKDGKPVYVAQVDVQSDGSYQQYFRAIDVEHGQVIHIFQGDYTVDVFKYVVKNSTPSTTTQT